MSVWQIIISLHNHQSNKILTRIRTCADSPSHWLVSRLRNGYVCVILESEQKGLFGWQVYVTVENLDIHTVCYLEQNCHLELYQNFN